MSINKKEIQDIDPNFMTERIKANDVEFFNCLSEPFEIYGLVDPKNTLKYMRLPGDFINKNVNDGVKSLLWHTSGGRVRFATNSPYIAVIVELKSMYRMMHMPPTGQSGIDLYTSKRGSLDQTFKKVFFPVDNVNDQNRYYDGYYELGVEDNYAEREITLNFPLYNGVNKLYIGLKAGSKIYKPVPYEIKNPIVFYGSSITQGACASRPGNCYASHLSRWLKSDFINLGFSGSDKGEIDIAKYIATLNLSAFVMDYEANSPSIEHLIDTHYPFYKYIRNAKPNIPIIMLSFPKYPLPPVNSGFLKKDIVLSREVILSNYLKGINEGDRNLYFIDGETLFGVRDQDACSVDNCHPNDLGFYRMAEAIYPILKKTILK